VTTDSLLNRKREVPSDFDIVANTYDVLVGRNPGYLDHLRVSADRLEIANEGQGCRLLDLCCGTGLSTEALADAYPKATIVGLDASLGMLDLAKQKSYGADVSFVLGDAMNPSEAGIEGQFDGILMAYGIRNMPDADACLERLLTLLKPEAPIVFHEYSVKDSVQSRITWDIVAWLIIIPNGLITARHTRIYRYLWRSVRDFDGVRQFENRLARHGFVGIRTLPMSGWQRNIVHSFRARRRGVESP